MKQIEKHEISGVVKEFMNQVYNNALDNLKRHPAAYTIMLLMLTFGATSLPQFKDETTKIIAYIVCIISVLFSLYLVLKTTTPTSNNNDSRGVNRNTISTNKEPSPEIIFDGLGFIYKMLDNLAQNGGNIVSTAIFEDYREGDKITNKLKSIITTDGSKFEFKRLLLLDDPSAENAWIDNFLRLKDCIKEETNGYIVIPRVLHIKSKARPLIRYLSKRIPKISITIIRLEKSEDGNESHLVYLGFAGASTPFGLVFRDSYIYSLTQDFLVPYQENATLINEQGSSLEIDKRYALLRRIKDALLELSEHHEGIIHLGLFGSHGKVEGGAAAIVELLGHEADLDVLIVVSNQISINDAMMDRIRYAINNEKLDYPENIGIEFSNLENRYYEKRSSVHIDIQLHQKNDRYYMHQDRMLLAYSIFSESYISLYSENQDCLSSILPFPNDLPCLKKRITLVLESPEYGLLTAVKRLSDEIEFSNTDPLRVLWIQACNYVWALKGKRPFVLDQVTECFINTENEIEIPIATRDKLELLLDNNSNLQPDKAIRTSSVEILSILIDALRTNRL